jgi:hypothetical protein
MKKHTKARLEDAIIDHLYKYRTALITTATTVKIDLRCVELETIG